jgi:hypothetical protein
MKNAALRSLEKGQYAYTMASKTKLKKKKKTFLKVVKGVMT